MCVCLCVESINYCATCIRIRGQLFYYGRGCTARYTMLRHIIIVQKNVRVHLNRSRVLEMSARGRSFSGASSLDSESNSHQPTAEKRLTICVVGSGGVGKSSLTVRYLQGHFPEVTTYRYKYIISSPICCRAVNSCRTALAMYTRINHGTDGGTAYIASTSIWLIAVDCCAYT